MSQKIREGNDIDIRWSLLDEESNPYILDGREVSIELHCGKKRVKIKEIETDGNTVHFVYYGKDQKYLGSYNLCYIENDGEKEMVTFDIKDAFNLVEHSWLAIDDGETPDTVQLEFVTVTSNLLEKIGPRGYSAYELAVQHGYVGTEAEWLISLRGEDGHTPVITSDANGNIYIDGVLLTDVVARASSRANNAAGAAESISREVASAEEARVTAEQGRVTQANADHSRANSDHAAAIAATAAANLAATTIDDKIANTSVTLSTDQVISGRKVFSNQDGIKIGDATLWWDAELGVLRCDKPFRPKTTFNESYNNAYNK